MNYSKNVIRLAREITSHYAQFNTLDQQYLIDIDDIADFDLHELSALIMSEDKCLASEATGCDNPAYDKTMLPALTRYLERPTDKDKQIEFMSEWKEGVTSYFKSSMLELFESAASEMNDSFKYSPRTTHDRSFHVNR
jgi:hypothetical protein